MPVEPLNEGAAVAVVADRKNAHSANRIAFFTDLPPNVNKYPPESAEGYVNTFDKKLNYPAINGR